MELQKIYTDDKGILTAFAESRIGGRTENQDSYGWQDTSLGYAVTVCDGMGGGPGGKTASTIAVKEIIAGISEANKDEEVPNIIIKAIRRANMAILEAGNENPKLKGMGSTATVLLISEKSAYIAHVGDSRVYQLRRGKKIFRTFDHSMVFEMVEQGVITEEQARLSAQSNVITRALGIKPDVEVEIQEVPYEKGDRFMLCTDGIHGSMPEKELVKMASNRKGKLGVVTDDIATSVDNLGRSSGGGHDNLTLAIIETKINSKLKPKMSTQTRFTLMGLIALFVISVALNVVQCTGSTKKGTMATDTTALRKDSLLMRDSANIKELKQALKDIGEQVGQISSNNITPVDSIKRIIDKNNK
mgnify:CR=1 FL=1